MLFGSELFEEYIGQLALASMSSLDVFGEGDQIDSKKLQDKMRVQISLLKFPVSITPFSLIRHLQRRCAYGHERFPNREKSWGSIIILLKEGGSNDHQFLLLKQSFKTRCILDKEKAHTCPHQKEENKNALINKCNCNSLAL
jgi:hypothetical protein